MRILLVHRHFEPDTPTYARMLAHMARALAAAGHEVEVLTSQPSYHASRAARGERGRPPRTERVNGHLVRRARMPGFAERSKALGSLAFFLAVVWHLFTRRPYDVVSVATIPPVVMGLCGRLAQLRGSLFLYHCMDIHPEAAIAAGVLTDSPLTRLMRRIDAASCRAADLVVVLSADMARTMRARHVRGDKVTVRNNFDVLDVPLELDTVARPVPAEGDRLQLVFAGNLGRFQQLDVLCDAIDRASQDIPRLTILFLGSGAMEGDLRQRASRTPARFEVREPVSLADATALCAAADLAVVSLAGGVVHSCYPSKLITYLRAGCRVLVVAEEGSELVDFVRANDLGTCAPPGDTDALAKAMIEEARALPDRDEADSARIQAVGEAVFGRERALAWWVQTYENLEHGR
ncbi:MAG: glycosyltransferase family 4 protein [Acidimicrobiia bacterium]|nr:glycosyltransferase family 4 protein [Acidimicrobiia bacterium]